MSTCANACVRVFVHMHLYLFYPFVRVCKSVCMYVATCTCIYASIRKSTHLRMYTCIYACERECTDVYVYLRMCTCIYACVRVSTHVYVYLFSSIGGAYAMHPTCIRMAYLQKTLPAHSRRQNNKKCAKR